LSIGGSGLRLVRDDRERLVLAAIRLMQGVFDLLAFGDVRAASDIAEQFSRGRNLGRGPRLDPSPFPIMSFHARLRVEGRAIIQRSEECVRIVAGVVGMHERLPAVAAHLFFRLAKELHVGSIDVLDAPLGIGGPDHDRRAVGQ